MSPDARSRLCATAEAAHSSWSRSGDHGAVLDGESPESSALSALGTSRGRRFSLHPPTVAFARHHDIQITSCQAADAKRKGKVERPFRQLRGGFLAEQDLDPPASLEQLNDRALGMRWV